MTSKRRNKMNGYLSKRTDVCVAEDTGRLCTKWAMRRRQFQDAIKFVEQIFQAHLIA